MVDNLYSVGINIDSSSAGRALDDIERRFRRFEQQSNRFQREILEIDAAFDQAGRAAGGFGNAIVTGLVTAGTTAAINQARQAVGGLVSTITGGVRAIASFTNEGTKLASAYRLTEQTISSVAGSARDGAEAFSFFTDVTERLGFSQDGLSGAYLKLLSSAQAAGLGVSETNEIFGSFVENARAFSLTTENIDSAITQISQTLGNENAQWEELSIVLESSVASQSLLRDALGLTQEEFSRMRRNGTLPATESILALSDALSGRAGGGVTAALGSAQGQANQFTTQLERFQRNLGGTFLPLRQEVFRIGTTIISQLNEENDLFDELEKVASDLALELARDPEIIDDITEGIRATLSVMTDLTVEAAKFSRTILGAVQQLDNINLGTRRTYASITGREGIFDVEQALINQGLSRGSVEQLSEQVLADVRRENRFRGFGRPQREEQARRLTAAGEELLRDQAIANAYGPQLTDEVAAQIRETTQVREEAERSVGDTAGGIQEQLAQQRAEDAQREFEKAQTDAQRLADEKQRLLEQETSEELAQIRGLYDLEVGFARELHDLQLGFIEVELDARLRGLGDVERESGESANRLLRDLQRIEDERINRLTQLQQSQFQLAQGQQYNQAIGTTAPVPIAQQALAAGGGPTLVGLVGSTGLSTGPHLDIRVRGGGRDLSAEELGRFQAGGRPITDFTQTSPFGTRIHPITGELKHHGGRDFAIPTGTEITTTSPISRIDVRDPSQTGGGGWVTDVLFEDGFEASILHQIPDIQSRAGARLGATQATQAVGGSQSAIAQPQTQDLAAIERQIELQGELVDLQDELAQQQSTGAVASYLDDQIRGYRNLSAGLEETLEVRRLELSLSGESAEFTRQTIQAIADEAELVRQLGSDLNQLNFLYEQGALTAEEFEMAQSALAEETARIRELRADARQLEYVNEQLQIETRRTETLAGIYDDQAGAIARLRLEVVALSEGREGLSRSEERHLELQRDGINLTAEEAAVLREQDLAIEGLTQQQEALQEAQSAIQSFDQTLIGGLANTSVEVFSLNEDIGDSFVDLTQTVLRSLAGLAANSFFSRILGGVLGGPTGSFGSIFLPSLGSEPFLGSFASGGIIDRQGVARVGEGNRAEAIVPLSNNRAIPVQMTGGGASPIVNSSMTINVNSGPGGSTVSVEQAEGFGQEVQVIFQSLLDQEMRHGGKLDRAMKR